MELYKAELNTQGIELCSILTCYRIIVNPPIGQLSIITVSGRLNTIHPLVTWVLR